MRMKFLFLLAVVTLSTEENLKDRFEGALFGLAAGDKNGGPMRMAVRLLESIIENEGTYDAEKSVEKIKNWMAGPPSDVDQAFDTGITCEMWWEKVKNGENHIDAAKAVCEEREKTDGYKPIGINTAHRGCVLALLPEKITQEEIKNICQKENANTHYIKETEECLFLSTMLARFLIFGQSWDESFAKIQSDIPLETTVLQNANLFNFDGGVEKLSKNGFAPNVMKSALYFVQNSNNFDEAIDTSVSFAKIEGANGMDNFCPVLVGAWAGARWGKSAIAERHLEHVPEAYMERLINATERLFAMWKN